MRKATIICLVLMMALAAVGYGYAKWSDSVTATVTVNTGEVCVGIRDVGTDDDGSDVGVPDTPIGVGMPGDGGLGADPQYGIGDNHEGKDVASKISVNGTRKFTIDNTVFYDSVIETIYNGYPWYGPTTVAEIANGGTIPVKIDDIKIEEISDPYHLLDFLHVGTWTVTVNGTVIKTGTGEDDLLGFLNHYQLHAKDVMRLSVQQCIAENNPENDPAGALCPENASATLKVTITASQWNEVN